MREPDQYSFYTDWSILHCSVFHLVYNAVKHSKKGTAILIRAEV